MKKLFLVGFMGSGKSTLGKSLARQLKRPFLDLDQYLEEKTGKSVPELFATLGEDRFRELEAESLRELDGMDDKLVVACGGGTPCYHGNMDWINEHGLSFYLKATPRFLLSRLNLSEGPRPLIDPVPEEKREAFIRDLLSEREQYYAKSRFVIDIPGKGADEVIHILGHIN